MIPKGAHLKDVVSFANGVSLGRKDGGVTVASNYSTSLKPQELTAGSDNPSDVAGWPELSVPADIDID